MRRLAFAQGAFYVATGLWPLFHRKSFELASGPKIEKWLVQAMGALITAVGATLLLHPASRSSRTLGALSAAALGGIDVWYAGKGRIKKTYLLDAVAEACILGLHLSQSVVEAGARRGTSTDDAVREHP